MKRQTYTLWAILVLLASVTSESIAQAPPNDECAGATVIGAIPFNAAQDTRLATPNPSDPILTCADGGGGNSVWFTYTADSARFLKFSTLGSTPSNYDVALALFTGSCASLTQVACNDDAGGTRQSEIFFLVEAGTTYYVHVAEWNGGGPGGGVPTGGDLVFNVTVELPPPAARGPRSGSVPNGVSVNTDDFAFSPAISATEMRVIPHMLDTRTFTAPKDLRPPKGPEGSNYIEDRGVSSLQGGSSLPVVIQDFPGIHTSSFPPDPEMAVGPNHVMACVNTSFRIWDKNGTVLKTISAALWLASALPGANPFDPQIIYDHHDNRWVMTWDNQQGTTTGEILVSVSDDDDPIGTWYNWSLPSHQVGDSVTTNWSDYPQLGFDDQALYVTGRQFGLTTGGFNYMLIRIIGKAQLYANTGGSVTWTDFWDLRDPDDIGVAPDGIQPTVSFDSPGTAFFMNDSPFSIGTYFTLWKITDPLGSPTISAVNIPVVQYSTAPNADQLGGSTTLIEAGGTRLRGQPVYRDSSLWAVHSIANPTNSAYSALHYVRFNPFSNTNLEDAAMGVDGFWHFYPTLMVNQDTSVVVTFSRSGLTEYVGAFVSGRKDTDPPGLAPSVPIKVGEANYVVGATRNRWGDYMGIALDPVEGDAVWAFTEYAASPGNRWGTWVGKVKFDPPGAFVRVDPSFLNFGIHEVGTSSDTLSVTITSNGLDTLVVTDISLSLPHFALVNAPTTPLSLSSGSVVTMGIVFAPTAHGSFSDTVVIASNATNTPTFQIVLQGNGFLVTPAQADVIYATNSAFLFSVDQQTGATTQIGPTGFTSVVSTRVHPTTNVIIGLSPSGANH
ncbi:MAG: hypothetical protein O7D34_02355, partial [Ignavibacteria bacterium]|nr:hypothetical protein [Ignavibacteria bacterium]